MSCKFYSFWFIIEREVGRKGSMEALEVKSESSAWVLGTYFSASEVEELIFS